MPHKPSPARASSEAIERNEVSQARRIPQAALPPLRLERRVDGQLCARRGHNSDPVRVVRCFPWSKPTEHLSLRNDKNDEVAYVTNLEDLEPASQDALAEVLVTAGFVLDVLRVEAIDEEFEVRCWKVLTQQGRRRFQTPRDSWPRRTPNGDLLLEDVSGDLFRLPPMETLDRKSRKLLFAHVD